MNQNALFPVDQTTKQQCTVCGATREAGTDKATECDYDVNPDGWHGNHRRRPAKCLNLHDPRHVDLPF